MAGGSNESGFHDWYKRYFAGVPPGTGSVAIELRRSASLRSAIQISLGDRRFIFSQALATNPLMFATEKLIPRRLSEGATPGKLRGNPDASQRGARSDGFVQNSFRGHVQSSPTPITPGRLPGSKGTESISAAETNTTPASFAF